MLRLPAALDSSNATFVPQAGPDNNSGASGSGKASTVDNTVQSPMVDG